MAFFKYKRIKNISILIILYCFNPTEELFAIFHGLRCDMFLQNKLLLIAEKKLKQISYYSENLKKFKITFSENFYRFLIPKNLIDELGGPNMVLKIINRLVDVFIIDIKYHKIEFLVNLSGISCSLLTYNQKAFKEQYSYQIYFKIFLTTVLANII